MNNFIDKICKWEEFFNSKEFEEEFYYDGSDLGCTYTKESTSFCVWSPVACDVKVKIYEDGVGDTLIQTVDMKKSDKGTWRVTLPGDYKNKFYTYLVTINNIVKNDRHEGLDVNYIYTSEDSKCQFETIDIYAKALGANSKRGMVVDFADTNPTDWDKDKKPAFENYTDAIIYELHVRDLSACSDSGIKNVGKFLGIVEPDTKNSDGLSTGLAHMKELGITHVHLLPTQDYGSIDETGNSEEKYNWGYDPVNYNTPEGSYSTNPYDGNVRIKEFKTMVRDLHKNGIRVVMDVVYNHTYDTEHSAFDKIVPNYYHRTADGKFTNGSGCGNETASDRAMFRKFMIDSIKYWISEYHVDGFRFDLMAVHDIETISEIMDEARKLEPTILIYGEGWIGGSTRFDCEKACFKVNVKEFNGAAVFNDEIRDSVKGSVMDSDNSGFATGGMYKDGIYMNRDLVTKKIQLGLAGMIEHPQIAVYHEKLKRASEYGMEDNYSWCESPCQTINYVSAHDNWTLWDKIQMSNRDEKDINILKKMNKLSFAIVMMSQGIPFFYAGEELLRTKKSDTAYGGYEGNSYDKGDDINMLRWDEKKKNLDIFNYYKGLIKFRKAHKAFRMTKAEDIKKCMKFTENTEQGIVAFEIENIVDASDYSRFYVVFNGLDKKKNINLPDGEWLMLVDENTAGNDILCKCQKNVDICPLSAHVFAMK